MKCCTLTRKICQYYHLPLYRAIIIAVQMVELVSGIMDTPAYSPLTLVALVTKSIEVDCDYIALNKLQTSKLHGTVPSTSMKVVTNKSMACWSTLKAQSY
jgi:hypothetical protein